MAWEARVHGGGGTAMRGEDLGGKGIDIQPK